MTPAEAAEAMREIDEAPDLDAKMAHIAAVRLLCDVLTGLGYGDMVEVFRGMTRHYA